MKLTLIIISSLVFVLSVTYFSVDQYRKYKAEKIAKETYLQLCILKNKIDRTEDAVKETSVIMIKSENETLLQDLYVVRNAVTPLENDIKVFVRLGNSQEIRKNLEKGFAANVVTPLEKIRALMTDTERIENFCSNRETVRNRALRNEVTLKAILKKPIGGTELPADLDKISKYGKDLLSVIPQYTPDLITKINSLNDPNLNNSLGVMLLKYTSILNEVSLVAKTDQIKLNAKTMWGNAKQSYSKVKDINETIHWYDPKFDDGSYDSAKYVDLLSKQANALNYYENGNALLTRLEGYLNEIKTQYVTFISSNTYADTDFRHSKTVYEDEYYTDSDGDRRHRTKSRTKYYSTDGRIFYYTVTNINSSGRSDNRIKIDEKDSYDIRHSFGRWKTYDYPPDKREGYLVNYKPYGYDNDSIIVGGRYVPSQHILETGK